MNSKSYLVGGFIRDSLLNLKPKDRDFVITGSNPDKLISQGFIQVGAFFPVYLHPLTKEEWALARTEKKTGKGYGGFEFDINSNTTIKEDLSRRDLTINAIAFDLETNDYIDPFNGIDDINKRILRHVSDAFSEDPLRILRVARFYARYKYLGFSIAPETIKMMKEMVGKGEINYLTKERIWMETHKALCLEKPSTYFEFLNDIGALQVIMPELAALWGVPQSEKFHPEIDAGIHSLMSLDASAKLTDDPITRFSVLVHDLGKGITPKSDLPRHLNHEKTGSVLINQLCNRIKTPKSFRVFATLFAEQHTNIHRSTEMNHKSLLKLIQRLDAARKPERYIQLCIAAESDSKGRLTFEDKEYPQSKYIQDAAIKLSLIDFSQIDFSKESGRDKAHLLKIDTLKQFIKSHRQ